MPEIKCKIHEHDIYTNICRHVDIDGWCLKRGCVTLVEPPNDNNGQIKASDICDGYDD